MSDPDIAPDRYDLPLAPGDGQNLGVEEVRVLWSFVHGDIMDTQTRARLHANWGLCARHAWGYAVVEIELWESGAGKRGGHQPFDLSILYAYLLERMVVELGASRTRTRSKLLTGHGSCLVCDDIRGPELRGIIVTHAGFQPDRLATEANGFAFTRAWFDETAAQWQAQVCPECAQDAGCEVSSGNLRCRLHQIDANDLDDETSKRTVAHLAGLYTQMLALTESMTQRGDPSTPEIDASWIRTLGWFHGWNFPLILTKYAREVFET